jgi:hypothetical protein
VPFFGIFDQSMHFGAEIALQSDLRCEQSVVASRREAFYACYAMALELEHRALLENGQRFHLRWETAFSKCRDRGIVSLTSKALA